MVSNFMYGLIG